MKKTQMKTDISYGEAKIIIENNIKAMSQSFIVVGYYLKYIRDNEMYRKDGYVDIWEFANQIYGIKKTTASRWMAMNSKFSKDGNSPVLQEVYEQFSKSQLQEMLYLEEEQLEDIKPKMTVKEIRKVRNNEPEKTEIEKKEDIAVIRRTYMEALAKYLIKIDVKWFREDLHRRVLNVETSPKEIRERFCKTSCSWSFVLESGELCRANLFEKYVQLWDENDNCIGDFEWFYFAVSIQEMWNIVAIEEIDMLREERAVATSQQEDRECLDKSVSDIVIDAEPDSIQEEHPISWFIVNYCENSPHLHRIIQMCEENEKNAEKAKEIQKLLSSGGYSGGGNSEFGYEFKGYNEGIIFESDGQKLHLTYIQFVREFEEIYGTWQKEISVATSQQERSIEIEKPAHYLETKNKSQCIQRPEYFCTLNEAQKLVKGNGEDCSASCCWNCEKHGQCGYECNSSAHRSDISEPADQDDNGIELSEEDCVIKEYPTNLSHEEKRVLEDALVRSKESLEVLGEEWKEKQPGTYIKHKTLKAAYELMLMHGTPEKKYEPDLQPELQKFKNNEQRKEFIYDYKSWPVWFESKETGETHYRYNLPDGSSIVVRHYFQFLEWKNEDIENEEFFLLKDKKYFRDCSTNVTTLIEHLKEIQKK